MKTITKILLFLLPLTIVAIYYMYIKQYEVKDEDMPGKYILIGNKGGMTDTLILNKDGYYEIIDSNNYVSKRGKWFKTVESYYVLENFMDVKPFRTLIGDVCIPINPQLYGGVIPDLYYFKIDDRCRAL